MKAFNNRVVHTKSKELLAWRQNVAARALEAGIKPADGAVEISLRFYYERPKTVTRALPTVPPDLDKQIRSVLDALKGVAYVDDGQVVSISATKEYGIPGAEISVSQPTRLNVT